MNKTIMKIENFGPIRRGKIVFKPFTILIGKTIPVNHIQ